MKRARGLLGLVLLVTSGCGRGPSGSSDWENRPPVPTASHALATHLEGRVIGLDPGHGGDPQKQVEARANLGVALALAKLLERDGARVVLSRLDDRDVALPERARLLEQAGAEVLVSLHHNAADHEAANYTSTWYHATGDESPASLDLAAPIQRRVMEFLRTPARLPTPLLSDHLMAPRSGFLVLRSARVPAVLCEASFYTHPEEARRLEDRAYLAREAYGYYLGLVDYFAGGTPRLTVLSVEPAAAGQVRITLELDDGLRQRGGWGSERPRVLASTILVRVAGAVVPHDYDPATDRLIALVPATASAELDLRFQNIFKHHNYPTRFRLERSGARCQLVPAAGAGDLLPEAEPTSGR